MPVLEAYGMTEAAPDDIKSCLLQCCKGRKGKRVPDGAGVGVWR